MTETPSGWRVPTVELAVPAAVMPRDPWGSRDPWAEAFAESARLGRPVPATERPRPDATADVPPQSYEVVINKHVQFFVDRFTGDRRKIIGAWFGRAGRYLGMIHDVLRKHGLPEELAFTAMIESGFNPVAVSRAGAKGLWQFMADTGRRYGLRVDHWVDERLDPEKSTAAAAAYLRDLYKQFGSWILALAAYNAGEMTVVRAIRATGSDDFWAMVATPWLQAETKDFVPQIQAATMIGREPDRYGFEPVTYRPEPMDRVVVPPATDLRRLAVSAGLLPDTLRNLNPVLIRGVSPPNAAYELRVPAGTRQAVQTALGGTRARFATVAPPAPAVGPPRAARAAGTAEVHVVRPRETVTSIARRYGVSPGDVLRWNALGSSDPIRPGDRLRVGHGRQAADRDAPPGR